MAEVGIQRIEGSAATPALNVVFVHGLGGDARGTWTFGAPAAPKRWFGKLLGRAPDIANTVFRPEWIATEKLGQAKAELAVFSLAYPSDPKRWKAGWPIAQAATATLDRLMNNRDLRANDAPIAFVCHSLGGLIVKKLLLTAHSDRGQDPPKGAFLDRIAGVAFLATPHGGSFLATLGREFHWLVSDSLRDLDGNSVNLLDLSVSYRNLVEDEARRIRHRVYSLAPPRRGAGVRVAFPSPRLSRRALPTMRAPVAWLSFDGKRGASPSPPPSL